MEWLARRQTGIQAAILPFLDTFSAPPCSLLVALLVWKAPRYWQFALGLISLGCCTLTVLIVILDLADPFSGRGSDGLGALVFISGLMAVLAILGGIGMSLLSGLVDFVRRPAVDLFHWTGVVAFAVVVGVPCMAILFGSW